MTRKTFIGSAAAFAASVGLAPRAFAEEAKERLAGGRGRPPLPSTERKWLERIADKEGATTVINRHRLK